MTDTELPVRLTSAALIGLAVGLEREWSSPADGQEARFAGIRTFFLLGVLGGIAGMLLSQAEQIGGGVVLVGACALVVSAYVGKVLRRPSSLDATTEVAAFVVLALGMLAMSGRITLAAGITTLVVLMLGEKARLHWLVHRISEEELTAALRFAVLAVVVLPLMPPGPYGGVLDIRPRALWAVVLLLSGVNFAGYVARRLLGERHGYGATGLLGGLVSSTAVTLQFARMSRQLPAWGGALARGAIGACTVLYLRVIVLSTILDSQIAWALIPLFVLPFAVGVALFMVLIRRETAVQERTQESAATPAQHHSPLGLLASIRMAVVFQIGLSCVAVVRSLWGMPGLYASAMALGVSDVDALTVSMSRSGLPAAMAAKAIAAGIIANTILKFGIGIGLGGSQFRRVIGPGLAVLATATVIGLFL